MAGYKMPFNQYKACQRMTKNEFSRWIETFADKMWQQGYSKACEDIPEGAIIISNKEKLNELLLTVPGIGPKLCEKITAKIFEEK